jgi:hypothetical protein
VAEKSLPLMQKVIIDLPSFPLLDLLWLVVDGCQDAVAEQRRMVELLQHAIHIAGGA